MPYKREHSARITNPDKYESIRRENDAFGDGIDVLWGVLKDGSTEVQAIRFDALIWEESDVLEWLDEQNYEPLEFAPAEKPEATFRVAKVGTFSASTGEFKITLKNITEIIEAFNEAKGHGVLPALKYTHAKGSDAIGVGEITEMWQEDEWLMAKATVLDPRMREGLTRGTLTNISLEGQRESNAYGEKIYPLVLTAISILAPGEWPAVPGARLVDIAAGQSSGKVVINLENITDETVIAAEGETLVEGETSEDEEVATPVEETPDEEEALEEITVEDRLVELEARILALEEQISEPPEEEPVDEDEPSEDDIEEGVSANLTDVEGKILAGKREAFREYYDGLEDNSAKQIVLEALGEFAYLQAAPEILASTESSELGAGESEKEALSVEDRQEKTIRDLMARDNIGFAPATTKAVKEHPELFNEEE